MGPLVSALSEGARRNVTYRVASIREGLGSNPILTPVVEQVRWDALRGILSVAAPRLRALVEERGTRQADGTATLRLDCKGGSYTLTFGKNPNPSEGDHPVLDVSGPDAGDGADASFRAHFLHDDTLGPWCVANACGDQGSAVLDALDSLGSHLPPWDGTFFADPTRRLSAEQEMVRQDGGFPGPTCREHLETLRDEAVRGMMLAVANALPGLAAMQDEGGYRWGERYLSYDSTDKSGCLVPASDGVACFHDSINLMDDLASWVVGIAKTGARAGSVAVWAFDRCREDPVQAIDRMASAGISGLRDPHASVDLATGEVLVREGFDPGTLVSNVLHGMMREIDVFGSRNCDNATYDRTDFSSFTPGDAGDEFDEDDDEDEDAPLGPCF